MIGQAGPRAVVAGFLDEIRHGPASLLVDGEAGTGKTSLWNVAVASARARGYRVLASRPIESEAGLAFAGLGDLLDGVVPLTDVDLPEPQHRALRVAILLEDPTGDPPNQRAVSVATLALLRALSARAPVLVAVDDYTWLDRATARVLEFALRRLEREPVGFMAASRGGEENGHHLEASILGPRLHRLTPEPLDADGVDRLLRRRPGGGFPRPLLHQIAEASGGNPLFAIEIAEAIRRDEIRPEPGQRLQVPRSLQDLVRGRLDSVSPIARELLVIAAAAPEPTLGILEGASSRADAAAILKPAVESGLIEIRDDRVRFVHPVFASTVYHELATAERRDLHRRLATLTSAAHERAHHLSLAVSSPDEGVAAALEEAARAAAHRGALEAAADLAERAHALTPIVDGESIVHRQVVAAEYLFAAGDTQRARLLLETVVGAADPGPERAELLRRLAKVRYRADGPSIAAQLLTRALEECGGDRSLRATIHRDLAWAVTLCGDVRDAAEHAAAALSIARPGDAMLAELLAADGMARFLLGEGVPDDQMARAVSLEVEQLEVPVEWRPSMMRAMMSSWSGNLDGARADFSAILRRTTEIGDETSLPFLLAQISENETRAGAYETALRFAQDAETAALQTGQDPVRAVALYATALAQAHLGRVDDARKSASAGLDVAEHAGSVIVMMLNQSVHGFTDLSTEAPEQAHRYLAPLLTWLDVVGISEPGVLRFVPDEIEALVALGEHDEANRLLRAYETQVKRLGRSWAWLPAARARALLSSTTGGSSAASDLANAIERHAADTQPFDLARAWMVLGTILRRTRKRAAGRQALETALEQFEELGARVWSARTRGMLGPNGHQNSRAGRGVLTPGEQRVADLVALGATNREVAARLFVSVRAVEVHLTSIYRKLQITSRTELAANHRTENQDGMDHAANAAAARNDRSARALVTAERQQTARSGSRRRRLP